MTIYQLNKTLEFPHPQYAEDDGLLAVGGDLSPKRLLTAYRHGIFPWYGEGDPILWWYTHPRFILEPTTAHIGKRLQRYWKKQEFTICCDHDFRQTIELCGATRSEKGEETWILPEMKEAYIKLHQLGYAHSVECWHKKRLVGGLYGLQLGKVFFGESMFSTMANSSKFALIHLLKYSHQYGIELIDCQMTTEHLKQFAAKEISGKDFYQMLQEKIPHIKPTQW